MKTTNVGLSLAFITPVWGDIRLGLVATALVGPRSGRGEISGRDAR